MGERGFLLLDRIGGGRLHFLEKGRRFPRSSSLWAMLVHISYTFLQAQSFAQFLSAAAMTTGIVVLPFENLNDQKESGACVDGLQDDILTKPAKIAELNVISRTSVMKYRGEQNTRQIGESPRGPRIGSGGAEPNPLGKPVNFHQSYTR